MSEPEDIRKDGADAQDAPPASARPRRPLGWRILRWVAGIALTLLVLVLGLLFYVLGTEHGLRSAVALVDRVAPGMLTIGSLDGRVLGPLRLRSLELHLATTEVRVGAFALDWSPAQLFSGVLSIDNLAASDIGVVLGPSPDEEKEPFALPSISIPFRLDVDGLSVDRLQLTERGADAPLLDLEHAGLKASLDGSDLQIVALDASLAQPRLSARAEGRATLRDAYPLGVRLDWLLALPPEVKLTGDGELKGDLDRLLVEHRVRGSLDADLTAEVRDLLKAPRWDGTLSVLKVALPDFQSDLPAVETKAQLRTSGGLDAATLTGSLDARAPDLPDFGHLAAVLDVLWKDRQLSIRQLDVTEQVSDAHLSAAGEVALGSAPGALSIHGDWKQLRWPLSGAVVARSTSGKLEVTGSLDDFQYALEALAEGPSFPAAKVALSGEGTTERTRLESLRVETLDGVLEGDGDLAWAPELTWTLRLQGKDLNPGSFIEGLDDRIVLSLKTDGSLERFEYDLSTTTSGPGLPPASLMLVGDGSLEQANVDTLRLDVLDGRIDGRATVKLDPKIGWEAALEIAGIDPGSYAPDWPGRIDGRLTTQGTIEDSGPDLIAVIERLDGALRGYPIGATGKVAVQGETIRIERVVATSGPSALEVDGTVGDTLALSFALDSPSLASVLPEAQGSVSAKGTVAGTLKSPQAKVELRAQDVAVAGNGVARLTGDADVDLAGDGRFTVRLDGTDLAAGSMRWDQLALRGEGSLPQHQVSLSLTGTQLSAKTAVRGGVTEQGYAGELSTLDLTSPDAGAWALQRSAPIVVEGPRVAAGPLCLRHAKGSGGCLELDMDSADQWTASIDLDKLDFALLEELLPEKIDAAGLATLKGRFQAKGGVLTGKAAAEIPKGLFTADLGKGQREQLDISSARLEVDSDGSGLSAALELPMKEIGAAQGRLRLPGWRLDDPAKPSQTLQGGLQADVRNLSLVSDMAPQLTGLDGAVDADLTLGGTLAQPGVKGVVRLQNLGFAVPLIALQVKDLNVTATAPTLETLTIEGGGLVGGGRLDISGQGGVSGNGFAASASITGTKLKVADTKEYYVQVSPSVEIEAGAEGAAIRGEIRIPEARIRPKSIPAGTVSPSSDVTLRETEPAPPYPVAINLSVVMGSDVTIDAFGVRGRLEGGLTVLQEPGKDILGDGQLQITDGEYRMTGGFGVAAELGAPLKITQGRLIYAKSPIENPGLLLQAERDGGDTTAGVRVLGTIRNPKLAFFSESDPGMTQAEITKYLMTGIPPSSNDQTDNAGLAVGTYVAPKIYMEYESGLGDEANKIRLRYDVSRHIELQTETGESQGADIYFKFEN